MQWSGMEQYKLSGVTSYRDVLHIGNTANTL